MTFRLVLEPSSVEILTVCSRDRQPRRRLTGHNLAQCIKSVAPTAVLYTAVSTKVVSQKCKSVRDSADWYYG